MFQKMEKKNRSIFNFSLSKVELSCRIIEDEKIIPPVNLTQYLYYVILGIAIVVFGVFFEKPKDYAQRKETAQLRKEAIKEIAKEDNQAVAEAEQKAVEQQKAKEELEKRLKLDKIKADIRAGKI